VEWGFEWVGFGPVGMACEGLFGDDADVGVEERAETVELVNAVEQAEDGVDRQGCGEVGAAFLPECRTTGSFQQEDEQEEQAAGEQIEAGGEAREQVQSEGRRADQKGAPGAGLQPFVLEGEADKREETDVVVLHHVLRVVQVRGEQEQSERAGDGLVYGEVKLAQKAEGNERGEDAEQDVGAEGDEDAADGWVVAEVVGEDGEVLDPGADDVGGEHEQRLTDTVPALQGASAAVDAEFGEFVGEYRRLGCPESVSGLQAVGSVGGAQFSGLDGEGDQARGEGEQKDGVTKKAANQRNPHLYEKGKRSSGNGVKLHFTFGIPCSGWNPNGFPGQWLECARTQNKAITTPRRSIYFQHFAHCAELSLAGAY